MSNILSRLIKPRSLAGKLTLIYGLSVFILLVVISIFLYMALIQSIDRENLQFLHNEVAVIRGILKNQPDDISSLEGEIPWNSSLTEIERYHYFGRILDANGQVLIETPGMVRLLQTVTIPVPAPNADGNPQLSVIKNVLGRTFLVMTVRANLKQQYGQQGTIQVALNISKESQIIDDYRRNLFLVILFGFLGSVGIGYITAKRGLQPIKDIAKKTEEITVEQLSERFVPEKLPTEVKAMAISLNKLLERIEGSFQRLSLFASDLAHELRTPIYNLMGEAEIALSKQRSDKEYQQVLSSSLEEYTHLSKIIDSLLFLARSDNSRQPINRELILLPEALLKLCEYHGIMAEEQGVKLLCQGQAKLYADPILFEQAISNLIVNALRHTSKGGSILIDVKQLKEDYVQITMSDTGSGIAPDHLPHVFDRFYRVDSARSKKFGGAGLGLAIVKSIMDLHQGKISISSELSKGTQLTLLFPGATRLA